MKIRFLLDENLSPRLRAALKRLTGFLSKRPFSLPNSLFNSLQTTHYVTTLIGASISAESNTTTYRKVDGPKQVCYRVIHKI